MLQVMRTSRTSWQTSAETPHTLITLLNIRRANPGERIVQKIRYYSITAV